MDELMQFFETLSEIPFEEILEGVNGIYEVVSSIVALVEVVLSGISLLLFILSAVVAAIVWLITYIVFTIPVYKLARKAGRKSTWMAWVPFLNAYFRTFVLADIAGDKELAFFKGKFKIKNRALSFWVYIGILWFGSALIAAIIAILNFIPVVGTVGGAFASLLYLLPVVATGFMKYAYLRDVLDMFKENKKS